MKEQSKASRVTTMLLVVILLSNILIGWIVIGTTSDTNARVAGIEEHMTKQSEIFQEMHDVFEKFSAELDKANDL